MNPKVIVIVASVVLVLVLVMAAVYFSYFRKTSPSEPTEAELAATKDSDGDGVKDVEELAQGTAINDPSRYPGSHKKVLLARRSIPSNILLSEDMFSIKEVAAKGEVSDAAITEQDKGRVVGRVSALEIKEGEYVLESMIYGGTPQLSFLVPKYKRAVSIRYEELGAVSGLIELGDVVDLIGYFGVRRSWDQQARSVMLDALSSPTDLGTYEYVKTFVQNARIVAKGAMFKPKDPTDTNVPPPPIGLTLSVYPHEAERLVWAQNYPKTLITLSLKSPQNSAYAQTSGITEKSFFDETVISEPRAVEVYRGPSLDRVVRYDEGKKARIVPPDWLQYNN